MACFQRFLALSAVASVLSGLGCAHQVEGPTFLTVSSAQYDLAFDAACKAARDEQGARSVMGLQPVLRTQMIGQHGRCLVSRPTQLEERLAPLHQFGLNGVHPARPEHRAQGREFARGV
jgi:hypothetical protein